MFATHSSLTSRSLATKMVVAAVAIAAIGTAARLLATPTVGQTAYRQTQGLASTAVAYSLQRTYADR